MIVKGSGSIFESHAEGLVNAVNCVGDMGAGLAKVFAEKYPLMHLDYKNCCRDGLLRPGRIHTYYSNLQACPIILNFPTKDDWRDPSKLKYIESGMQELLYVVNDFNLQTVAIPALGCGLGGLEWSDVSYIIEKYVNALQNVTWIIFDPNN